MCLLSCLWFKGCCIFSIIHVPEVAVKNIIICMLNILLHCMQKYRMALCNYIQNTLPKKGPRLSKRRVNRCSCTVYQYNYLSEQQTWHMTLLIKNRTHSINLRDTSNSHYIAMVTLLSPMVCLNLTIFYNSLFYLHSTMSWALVVYH